jgi:hypothetical protein
MLNVFREARIILPVAGNLAGLREAETRLVAAFGGYTRMTARGAWRDPDGQTIAEMVYVYDVACPAFMAGTIQRAWYGASLTLREIARDAARAMAQACVYVRTPDGEVHFIRPDGHEYNPDVAPPAYMREDAFWRERHHT